MSDVVIVDAARTPLGKRNGWLKEQHPVKLGAHAVKAAMERAGIQPEQVDHVIFGCVSQVSEQTFNIARNVVLEAGLPIEVPATSVDFQCGSSQQAVHLAAAMVASGQADVVIAGGVESMTRVPMDQMRPAALGGELPVVFTTMAAVVGDDVWAQACRLECVFDPLLKMRGVAFDHADREPPFSTMAAIVVRLVWAASVVMMRSWRSWCWMRSRIAVTSEVLAGTARCPSGRSRWVS